MTSRVGSVAGTKRLIAALLLLFVESGFAADQASADVGAAKQPVEYRIATDDELDAMRGGFMLPNGLILNISIEKRIYQNGVETFASFFEAPENLSFLGDAASNLGAGIDPTILRTITQNDLDNQIIKTISNINIELSNVEAVKRNSVDSQTFRNFIQPNLR